MSCSHCTNKTNGEAVVVIHPLEPLTNAEILTAVAVLKSNSFLTPTTRIINIILREPLKQLVFDWHNSIVSVIDREAIAVLFDNNTNTACSITMNLTCMTVLSISAAPPGSQPTLSMDEMEECEKAVLASEEFKDAVFRHYGLTDLKLVMVDIWSAGNYGAEEESTRRMARPLCFIRKDPTDNGYARPIEGIRPVVDLNTMTVIRVEEYGKYDIPPEEGNYSAERVPNLRKDIKPLHISQPDGPSFSLQGNVMKWQQWKFVIGFNAREGLTLHDIQYQDADKLRSILYRASLTEMVVPYGDPCATQRRKNAFDVGEYGVGACTNSLRLGCDCVGHIQYIDGHLISSRGHPVTIPNAICIHEEDFGILWKHTDRRLPESPEVRRSRRLVVSAMATIENYEYGYYWYFYQDGNIQFEVKLTGSLSLGVPPNDIDWTPKYGAMIKPKLYSPIHQHFFNVRLDFAIDGLNNSVQQVDIIPEELDERNPFENGFYANAATLLTEKQAKARLNAETMRTWKVVNSSVSTAVGGYPGYKLVPGDNSVPMASPNSWWRKRAGFCDYHVWVTPFAEEERYAAGDFPNQSKGGDGLPKYTQADRSIVDTDVVLWYTFGHTHVPRPEDYPVMPCAYIGFLLKPAGFFAHNPSNDVPPSAK